MYYSLLSFTKEDFALIPSEFWIGLVVVFAVAYVAIYKYFTKKLVEKEQEDNKENNKD